MADNKFVVTGEAPESDDEADNDSISVLPEETKNAGYGIAVNGEAVESDEEVVSYAVKSVSFAPETYKNRSALHPWADIDSIFQKKLCETNASLWKNLNTFMYSTILSASKELLSADQQLLKSQVTLQSISYNFKIAENVTKQILGKTKDILTSNFVPSIKI